MKKKLTLLVLSILLLIPVGYAQDFPTDSYSLSADGTTLLRWKGSETVIDMTKDSKLNQITTIGAAFQYNNKITQITLPNTLTTIKKDAFYGTDNLNSITVPSNVSNIEQQAIVSVKEIFVAATNQHYSSENGILYNKQKTIAIACGEKKEGIVEFPTTLKETLAKAFEYCNTITEVVFPEGMQTINIASFVDCGALTKINIPSTLTNIGARAFANCRSLTKIVSKVENPSNITLGYNAFSNVPTNCQLTVPTANAVSLYKNTDQWVAFTNIIASNGEEPTTTTDISYDTIIEAIDTIPNDWENDLRLNSYFKRMHTGDTYNIIARRMPEAIDNAISNHITHPTYHYKIVKGDNITVDNTGKITATALGTSIVMVYYDKMNIDSHIYGGTSPVNITYMIVDVVDGNTTTDIKLTTDIKTAHYDTHYFFGSGVDYTFAVTTNGADKVAVKCNDKVATNNGNQYTIRLQNRANIVEIIATKGTQTEKLYYVIDGRKIALNIVNTTDHNRLIPIIGDKVQLSFKGITLPVYKMATIYNPQMEMPDWNAAAPKVIYSNTTLGEIKTNVNITQYDLSRQNTIEFTPTESGTYTFTDGHINESWWGSKLGTDIDMTAPGQPNLNAATESATFSELPAFRVQVADEPPTPKDAILDLTQTTTPTNIAYNEKDIWKETYNDTDFPYIVSQDFSFAHLSSQNSWNGSYWDGFTISKSTDNATNHSEFPARQWGNMAQGGVKGKSTPYLIAFHGSFMETQGKHSNSIQFKDNKTYLPKGVFVNNTAYTTKCIEDGFFVARAFTKNDTYILTAHATNKDNQPTGKKVDFYLADYRSDKIQNRILNNRWEWFDLSSLGNCEGIYFTVKSTDAGQYGDNTASYFAIDRLIAAPATTSDITHITQSTDIDIYPHIATSHIRINHSGAVAIYTANGIKVHSNSYYKAHTAIDLSNLPRGIYFVKIENTTQKIIKK